MTVLASYICDDKDLIEIRHQGELLGSAFETLRIRMEIIKEQQDHQTEVLKEIKEYLSSREKAAVTSQVFDTTIKNLELRMKINDDRLDKVLNEIKEKLSAMERISTLDTAIKSLRSRMDTTDESLGNLTKALDNVNENLSAMQRTSATSTGIDASIKNLGSRMDTTDERLENLTKVLDNVNENLSAMQRTSATSTGVDASIKNLGSRMDTTDERLGNLTKALDNVNENLSAMQRTSATSTGVDASIKNLGSRMDTTDERLGNLTKVLDTVNENDASIKNLGSRVETFSERSTGTLQKMRGIMLGIEEKGNISVYSTSCLELSGGIQVIQIDTYGPQPFRVLCDNTTDGGGWTVIQRRLDGSVDFYRNWTDYKIGFGNLTGEFFIGLDKLHAITNSSLNELFIVLRDKQNKERFARYDAFAIAGESQDYELNILGKYNGNAGDSLLVHKKSKFSTKGKGSLCAKKFKSPWWYATACECGYGRLNGQYGNDKYGEGINWDHFHGPYYSLRYASMMIRPKKR